MIGDALRGWRGLLGLAVLGGIVWSLAPAPTDPARLPAQAEPWLLPKVTEVVPSQTLEVLGRTNLWGKLPDAAAAPPLNDPEWRFLGIVKIGQERFVLIKLEGLPERRLNVNDILPGGSKIVKIEDDSLCILINGARRKLGIHNTGPRLL